MARTYRQNAATRVTNGVFTTMTGSGWAPPTVIC
jgi:hypothetical protein